jgi:predicted nuclease of predicted toxin-antitoxin system
VAWRTLAGSKEVSAESERKTRILVDESLGEQVAGYLRDRGYNAVFVKDVGLAGRSDEDVFAYAWRERRIIWTHDRDFLDDSQFPEHRNPGVLVLPGGGGDQEAMGVGIATAIAVFGHWPDAWIKTKSTISPSGEMTIRRRRGDSGKIKQSRYRLTRGRSPEEWTES